MATFEEIRKKVMKDEPRRADSFDELKRRILGTRETTIKGVTDEDVRRFFSDASDFMTAQSRGLEANSGSYSGWRSGYENYDRQRSEQLKRSQDVRAYINANRDRYAPEDYERAISSLDEFRAGRGELGQAYDSLKRYYDQREDEGTYNLAPEGHQEAENRRREAQRLIAHDSDGYKAFNTDWARFVGLSNV